MVISYIPLGDFSSNLIGSIRIHSNFHVSHPFPYVFDSNDDTILFLPLFLFLLLLLVRPYLSDFEIFMGATLFIDYYAFK